MTPEQFAYWLQGFLELSGDVPMTKEQVAMVREHLATVFLKVTPPLQTAPLAPLPAIGAPWVDPWWEREHDFHPHRTTITCDTGPLSGVTFC